MNILCYLQIKDQAKITGCEYYRQLAPHHALADEGFKITNTNTLVALPDEELIKYDAVHIIRKDFNNQIERLKKLSIPVIFDIDDYWHLHHGHLMEAEWKRRNYVGNILECFNQADFVTCSTNYLAEKIKPIRPDVMVIPNCPYPTDEQFIIKPKPVRDKVSIGWIGGTHHLKDLDCIFDSMQKVWADDEINTRIEIVLGGFMPDSSVHKRFVQILTGDYSPHAKGNIKLLPATNAMRFATMYDHCDLMLAPLKDSEFNRAKSQLKVVEAGWKGKAIIASNIEPYKHFDNVILIDERKNHKDWYKAIKKLVLNPNVIVAMQEQLYTEVHQKFNIHTHIWKLKGLYQSIKSSNSSTIIS
jgi:glycosyltransferase involved in cell wall biosynthesis